MAERWRYVDEELPPVNTTVLVVVEKDGIFGKCLDSYLDNYEQRTCWEKTIRYWHKASSNNHTVLAWLPVPLFERKENE